VFGEPGALRDPRAGAAIAGAAGTLAAQIAATTSGVTRVVQVFEYTD